MSIAAQIEIFLLDVADWVPSKVICARFCLSRRSLRASGKRPGLLDSFSVSCSKRGYKHVACLSTDEYIKAKHSTRKHGIGELRKTKLWDRARSNCLTGPRRHQFERHTGQGILILTKPQPRNHQ